MAQEEPDPAAAFDDPLAEPDTVGGDDPDAIAADQDFLGDPEVGGDRAPAAWWPPTRARTRTPRAT